MKSKKINLIKKNIKIKIESELPTHAKAMGWASGFNGCAT